MRKPSLIQSEAARGSANPTLADRPLCSVSPLCQRWNTADEGAYCRMCRRNLYGEDLAGRLKVRA